MELSHRDQAESSIAGGFLPANTHHPLTFQSNHSLSLLLPLKKKLVHLAQVLRYQVLEVIQSTHALGLFAYSTFVSWFKKANLWPVH